MEKLRISGRYQPRKPWGLSWRASDDTLAVRGRTALAFEVESDQCINNGAGDK